MKTFYKIIGCVLVLSMLFAFSACKNNPENQEKDNTTSSMTSDNEFENIFNDENDATSTSEQENEVDFFGEWYCDTVVSPQDFYTDFYNAEITKTNVVLRKIYTFNNDGTVKIRVEIPNISEVRKEYRSLMVAAGKANVQSKGKLFTTDDVLYYEAYADRVLDEIRTEQSGTYDAENNRIYYTSGGASFFEFYTFNGKEVTLTGSSQSNAGYPITLTKTE